MIHKGSSSNLINVAARLLSARLQEQIELHSLGVTIEQWRLLYYLWDEDGINQQELAGIAKKEKSTITRQINQLESNGFIKRSNNVKDKRNNLIYLTEKGKKLENKAMDLANIITDKSESGLSREEVDSFKETMEIIINNLAEK